MCTFMFTVKNIISLLVIKIIKLTYLNLLYESLILVSVTHTCFSTSYFLHLCQ